MFNRIISNAFNFYENELSMDIGYANVKFTSPLLNCYIRVSCINRVHVMFVQMFSRY